MSRDTGRRRDKLQSSWFTSIRGARAIPSRRWTLTRYGASYAASKTGPMKLSEILTDDAIVASTAATGKDEFFGEVVAKLVSQDAGIRREVVLEALRERERLGSTALDGGVAIPHARVAGLARPLGLLARSAAGVEWGAPDGVRSRLILVLVTPAEQSGSHLKLLAAASRVLRDATCRERLAAATDASEMLAAVRTCEDSLERH